MRTPTLLLTAFMLLASLAVVAQIEATFSAGTETSVILARYHGDRLVPVDTTHTDIRGRIRFETSNLRPGQYRLVFGKGNGTDFLFHHQPVNLQFDIPTGTTLFADTLNEDYQQMLVKEDENRKKLSLLENLLDEYPRDDPFYQKITAQYVKQQIDHSAYLSGLIRRHHTDLLGRMARMMKKPFTAPELDQKGRSLYQREHFWDLNEIDDTTLIATNIYPRRAIEFLTLYSNPEYTKDELQAAFIQGIEAMLPHISHNKRVFDFVMEYLIGGFEQFGFEEVIQYLATLYQNESCTDAETRSKLAGKAETIRRMAKGNPAPPLQGTTPDGKTFLLESLNQPYTLVIFWASWCTHCNQLLPQLSNLLATTDHEKLAVVAFSLDTNSNDWQESITRNALQCINISELKGWDSQAASDWGVFATPTLFLLGPGRKIVAKPYNTDELAAELVKQGIMVR